MFNKILFTFLLIFPNISFAAWSCPIETKTADFLTAYIQDVRTVITNITTESAKEKKEENSLKNDRQNLLRIYNQAINWDWYYSSFEYYAMFPILNEVPYPIKRDYRLLEAELEWLNKYLEKLVKQGYSDITIPPKKSCTEGIKKGECNPICNNVKGTCEIKGNNLEIVGLLFQSTSKVAHIYRETVVWNNNKDMEDPKLLFVPDFDAFRIKFNTNYGSSSVAWCPNSNGGKSFLDTITEAWSKIEFIQEKWANGTKKWEDAAATFIWKKPVTKDQEMKLLKKELERQGVSGSQQKAILKNLDDYNTGKWGFLDKNKSLSNSWSYFSENIKSQYDDFVKNLSGSLPNDKQSVSISEFNTTRIEKEIGTEIEHNINILFQTELPYAGKQDISTSELRAKIINMHLNISSSINIMEDTVHASETFCNRQARGKWNCNN